MPPNPQDTDAFDQILNLEEQYHAEGYALGVADGSKSGRIEGRIFGLQKGFEKFSEMGKLNGKAVVWQKQQNSERAKKYVDRLVELTDPENLAVENTEHAVEDFEEVVKEARTKALLIGKLLGEKEAGRVNNEKSASGKRRTGEMEDFAGLPRGRESG